MNNSAFVCNGASNHTEEQRQDEDYYATEPQATEVLLEHENFSNFIWEPACGGGHMAEVLKSHGYDVLATDLVYRGYGKTETFDFLKDTIGNFMVI